MRKNRTKTAYEVKTVRDRTVLFLTFIITAAVFAFALCGCGAEKDAERGHEQTAGAGVGAELSGSTEEGRATEDDALESGAQEKGAPESEKQGAGVSEDGSGGSSASGAAESKCTVAIRCDTIFDNTDKLADGIADILPEDGIILHETEIDFSDGDSVFDVLLSVTEEKKIHMEFTSTPVYDSAYIKGIANIYEFDCGDVSGWMYSVNGEFPNFGCSNYKVKSGDRIEWIYSCDLGRDIGNGSN